MSLSYRGSLKEIQEPRPGQPIPAFRSDFQTAPSSMRAAITSMAHPRVSEWSKANEGVFENEDWTEECQGVTSDGKFWYISSNNNGHWWFPGGRKQRIYRFDRNMALMDQFDTYVAGSNHLGDIDYYQGRIYAALEEPIQVLMVSTSDFSTWSRASLRGPTGGSAPQDHMSWCAINPWNGYLYSSQFDGVAEVFAYDPAHEFTQVPAASIRLEIATDAVQGGCFSNNGHLYLSSNASNDIRGFSALNGAFLGSAAIEVDHDEGEEVEGVAVWKGVPYDGTPGDVHVILLDNDDTNQDDVFFKHYSAPFPERV
jgi:hypothetical protein